MDKNGNFFPNRSSNHKTTLEVVMKKNRTTIFIIAASLLLLAACAPAAVVSPSANNAPVRQISVVGVGQVYATPDIAYINVGVRSTADTVGDALEQNNAQARVIKDTLMAEGVAEEDIQTSSFNVYPQSDYDFQGAITRTYFVVENTVYVTVRDLTNLGRVLDAVANSGANNIYGISFDLQDKTPAQADARALAVDSARTQAQQLADLTGVQIGEIISITTFYSYPMQYYGYGMGGGGAAPVAAEVPIAAGQMQVNSEVTIVFAIK
jgi:hypothetical protein